MKEKEVHSFYKNIVGEQLLIISLSISFISKHDLSQRSARHGRPKAGRGAERAKRAERAQSAFTKNRVILTLPNTDHNKKNFFTCPKSALCNMIIDKAVSQKKILYPKSQVKHVDGSLTIFIKFVFLGLILMQNLVPVTFVLKG